MTITDAQILLRATNAVNDKLNADESFTILDVSRAVQSDGGPFVRHSQIRPLIKPVLDILIVGRGWDISTIDVVNDQGIKAEANLYHPMGADPSAYTNRTAAPVAGSVCSSKGGCVGACVPAAPVATAAPVPAPTAVGPAVPAHIARAKVNKVVAPRSDLAVEIPRVTLAEAGFADGDYVDVVNHPNSVSLVPGNDRVVSSTGFRLSANALDKSGLQGKTLYVYSYSDKVVISEK